MKSVHVLEALLDELDNVNTVDEVRLIIENLLEDEYQTENEVEDEDLLN